MKSFHFVIPITIEYDKKYFVIYSPALDIGSHGKTLDEAKKMFAEAVSLFIEYITEKGDTEKVLKSLGWVVKSGSYKAPMKNKEEISMNMEMNLPMNCYA